MVKEVETLAKSKKWTFECAIFYSQKVIGLSPKKVNKLVNKWDLMEAS